MASVWIAKRPSKNKGTRYNVFYRVGGRESVPRRAGSFGTSREARARKAWVAGELAALRVPDLSTLEVVTAPTLREAAAAWRESRLDVTEGTNVLHRVALNRVLPILGERRIDSITAADVQGVVNALHEKGSKRGTIQKSLTYLAQTLDFANVTPNPARDRVHVKLPREAATDMIPPSADHIEAACWLLSIDYMISTLILDATGVRVGEFEGALIADLDEGKQSWLVRASLNKTRKARWVKIPDDLYAVLVDRLPPREDRDLDAPLFFGVQADRLRTAMGRACRDAGVQRFGPHSFRHRRISLLHRQGAVGAEIGELMGQRSLRVTTDIYTHALLDPREVDRSKLLMRVSSALAVHTPVHTMTREKARFAA